MKKLELLYFKGKRETTALFINHDLRLYDIFKVDNEDPIVPRVERSGERCLLREVEARRDEVEDYRRTFWYYKDLATSSTFTIEKDIDEGKEPESLMEFLETLDDRWYRVSVFNQDNTIYMINEKPSRAREMVEGTDVAEAPVIALEGDDRILTFTISHDD